MGPRCLRRGPQCAYTIIELILIIVLLGILGAVAGPRFFDNASFDARRYQDELASALRYAQKIAVASGCPVRADIGSGSYALYQQPAISGHCNTASPSFSLPVLLPTGEPMQGTAPSGIAVAPAQSIVFDPLGRTSLPTDLTLSVADRSVTIRAGSGLVTMP